MKRSRFTKSQIVAILKEADSGLPVNEIWHKHGFSSATYYKWKSKYGGLKASEFARVKGARIGEQSAQTDVRRIGTGERSDQGSAKKCMVWPVLQGKRWSADAGQFALMYPASRESGAFGAKSMMRSARTVPNKLLRLQGAAFFAWLTPTGAGITIINSAPTLSEIKLPSS